MDEYLGVIKLFALNYVPHGYMSCEGQSLPIAQYQALYSLLGTNFGGDGITMFSLPDLREKEPVSHMKYYICIDGMYPPRD